MSQRTRRSHVVPKFYLKNFSRPPFWRLWVCDLTARKTFCAGLQRIAVTNDFYAAEGAQHEDELEHRLAVIENNAAASVRGFENRPTTIDSATTRFIAWLAARTGWIRRAAPQRLQNFLVENGTNLGALTGGRELPFEFEDISSGEKRIVDLDEAVSLSDHPRWQLRLTQDQFLDCVRIQAHIFQTEHFPHMQWMRLTAPEGFRFITSDRPVTWEVPHLGLKDEPGALKHPAVRLVVPLSSQTALLASHERGQTMRKGVSVAEVNSIVFRNAERYIYGSDKKDVELSSPQPLTRIQ